jgi:GPI mannosyltransferase 3
VFDPSLKLPHMRKSQAALIAATVRILQALLTRTFFQPDEYFQSLEVAHRAVFGYGQLTWEWSIDQPIRSILFPSVWIPVYWILSITGLHETSALVSWFCPFPCMLLTEALQIWAPKIMSGILASITDIAVCRLSSQLLGPRAVPITVCFWVGFSCSYSNTP